MRNGELPADIWDDVHTRVQSRLAALASELQAAHPQVHSLPGRTTGAAFALYSYRTFHGPDSLPAEPIVVGINVTLDKGRVSINADVCGEESGQVYFEARRQSDAEKALLVIAANEMAEALATQPDWGTILSNCVLK